MKLEKLKTLIDAVKECEPENRADSEAIIDLVKLTLNQEFGDTWFVSYSGYDNKDRCLKVDSKTNPLEFLCEYILWRQKNEQRFQ